MFDDILEGIGDTFDSLYEAGWLWGVLGVIVCLALYIFFFR